jgi:hypothetical protein
MLFLNVSSDQIVIEINGEKILLERNDIEDTIWPKLVDLFEKYKFSKIFLLNWPGWFTNLRVWTLAINLLNSLENGAFDVYSITKIDFFKYFVDGWILPTKWIIYIWQKKNVWLYDFNKWWYDTIKKEEINTDDNKLFFDLVYEDGYFERDMIDINIENEKIILSYNWKDYETTIEELGLSAEKIVDAKYFIKPIMWKQWQ